LDGDLKDKPIKILLKRKRSFTQRGNNKNISTG
jgi:hypothetical protein